MFLRPFAILFLLAALVVPAAAQETRGAIEGVVKDASGAILPGATVDAKGAMGRRIDDGRRNGAYRFPALAPGQYEVTATLSGFKPGQSKVVVAVGQLLKVDLSLAVGGLTETVTGHRADRRPSTSSRVRLQPTSRRRRLRCCPRVATSSRS